MATQTEVTPTLVYAQKGRAISVETVLGPDALLLESFEGEDEIAVGFRYTLGMLGKDPSVSAAQMIRSPATIKMTLSDGSERVINGLISKFVQLEQVDGLTSYEAELRPWFWFLSLSTDFRTFQNMSIPDIVKAVCKDQGFSDVTTKLIKPHNPHEYRVQYGETHLDFISRLMEEEGIFWFGEHDGKKCNLVLADANSVGKQSVKLRMSTVAHETEDEFVLQEFSLRQEVRPGQHTAIDYNFETPSTQLLSNTAGNHASEVVEYPAGFGKRDDGDKLSRLRHQEILAEAVEAEGTGRCRAVKVGVRVELSKHSNKNANGGYLVTGVKQSAKLGDFRSGGDPGLAYTSSFTGTPYDIPYRPARSTELPRAYGYESAVVVGPAGDEIYTDQYGRVKVQFFWDRKGKKDDKSSCWVRVSTVWAGKGWGAISTPRIGQEVLVAYLNGDPEDPIVVGRVYNAEQMPPYALPANKTQSGMKTRSTLGGTADNFNEIRFEDKKGSEELYIHAEKDKNIVVENDRSKKVGHDNTESIGNDETIKVGNDQSIDVAKDQTTKIGKNRTETVGADESVKVTSNRTHVVGENEKVTVGKNMTISVSDNRELTVGKDLTEQVNGALALTVDKDSAVTVGKNHGLTVDKKITIKAGDVLTIESDKEVLIKTGSASIHMKSSGDIEIKGNKIQVKADGDLVLKGSKIAAN
jgi:type VI secretion system secreted protein VgrG